MATAARPLTKAVTCPGVLLLADVPDRPVPSCPYIPRPHAHIVLSLAKARLCSPPPTAETTVRLPGSAVTWIGALLPKGLVVWKMPSPSSPLSPWPHETSPLAVGVIGLAVESVNRTSADMPEESPLAESSNVEPTQSSSHTC